VKHQIKPIDSWPIQPVMGDGGRAIDATTNPAGELFILFEEGLVAQYDKCGDTASAELYFVPFDGRLLFVDAHNDLYKAGSDSIPAKIFWVRSLTLSRLLLLMTARLRCSQAKIKPWFAFALTSKAVWRSWTSNVPVSRYKNPARDGRDHKTSVIGERFRCSLAEVVQFIN
jgi:hypothetical protein